MTRVRRLVVQLLLLPLLVGLDALDDNLFQLAVGVAIIVVWPVSLAAAGILVWLARLAEHEVRARGEGTVPASLIEAADNAVTMAMISTALAVAGLVAVGRVLGLVEVAGRPVLVLIGWALVLAGVPALSWGHTLRSVWLPMLAGRRQR